MISYMNTAAHVSLYRLYTIYTSSVVTVVTIVPVRSAPIIFPVEAIIPYTYKRQAHFSNTIQ